MDKRLEELLQEYLDDYEQKSIYSFIVKPSIPIVWFGNWEKYQASQGKIVTVALNPSSQEFPTNELPRFAVNARTPQALFATLNRYFLDHPYKRWFGFFQFVLNCFGATYYNATEQFPRTALHLDIYSAIATDPTWGKLKKHEQECLSRTDLFSKLLAILNPDLIIFSGNIRVFKEVFTKESPVFEKRFKNNGYIREYLWNNKIIVSGLNYRGQPFGNMSHAEMAPMFEAINRHLEERMSKHFY